MYSQLWCNISLYLEMKIIARLEVIHILLPQETHNMEICIHSMVDEVVKGSNASNIDASQCQERTMCSES